MTNKTPQTNPAPSATLTNRISDIEHRWGKNFSDILADIHDHIFGATTQEHLDAADARDQAEEEAAKKSEEENKGEKPK